MEKIKIEISAAYLIVLASSVLILPLQWVCAVIVSAGIHELGHCMAIFCCGGSVRRFSVGLLGAQLEITNLIPWQELLCALAGPVAGICTVLFVRWFPRMVLCALMQSAFNLLPIYPLDGGRVIRILSDMFGLGNRLSSTLEGICLILMIGGGLYAVWILQVSWFSILLPATLLYCRIRGKLSCKEENHWLQ